jgi:hypothetical protein
MNASGFYLSNYTTDCCRFSIRRSANIIDEERAVHLFTAEALTFQISRCRFLLQIYELRKLCNGQPHSAFANTQVHVCEMHHYNHHFC